MSSSRRKEFSRAAILSNTEEAADSLLVRKFQSDPTGEVGLHAASRLLTRYSERVLRWCWRLMGDRELALDLAQDILISAYQHLPDYNHRGRFGPWLYIIARNRCLSEKRRRQIPLSEISILDVVADSAPTPDVALERQLAEEDLQKAIGEILTVEEKKALWLRCFDDLPVETITQRMCFTQRSGARAVLQRARRKLRTALDARNCLSR